jgi:hypothetical protein
LQKWRRFVSAVSPPQKVEGLFSFGIRGAEEGLRERRVEKSVAPCSVRASVGVDDATAPPLRLYFRRRLEAKQDRQTRTRPIPPPPLSPARTNPSARARATTTWSEPQQYPTTAPPSQHKQRGRRPPPRKRVDSTCPPAVLQKSWRPPPGARNRRRPRSPGRTTPSTSARYAWRRRRG